MEHDIKLSILIPTIEGREEDLFRLIKCLQPQKTGDVEICIDKDRGETIISDKRNRMIRNANGKYICFVDDDDLVSDDYVESILEAIKKDPDCVGIEGTLYYDGVPRAPFKHSIDYEGWYNSGGVYYRSPNHLNPIKREIAINCPFPPGMKYGEDRVYSNRLKGMVFTECKINHSVYYYLVKGKK